MTTEKHESAPREEDGWVEVDGGEEIPASPGPAVTAEEPSAYGPKQSTRPGIVGMYTALVGLLLALLLIALPDIREFRFTNEIVLNTGYILMPIPAIALIWGVIGMVHREHRQNWRPAAGAIVVAVLSAALLAYAASARDAAEDDTVEIPESGRSLDMSEEELKNWRDEKLRR